MKSAPCRPAVCILTPFPRFRANLISDARAGLDRRIENVGWRAKRCTVVMFFDLICAKFKRLSSGKEQLVSARAGRFISLLKLPLSLSLRDQDLPRRSENL